METEELMVELMADMTRKLLAKVKSGEASSSDISNAIRLLQNNNITVTIKKGDPSAYLLEDKDGDLPFEVDFPLVN